MIFRIPEPFQFNPLKHHLAFIKDFISVNETSAVNDDLLRSISQIGTSVMDIYTGNLGIAQILAEIDCLLKKEMHYKKDEFAAWTGTSFSDFRIHRLEDDSRWTLKFHDSNNRYVHLFPARLSPHTFRVKANTLKSAILYCISYGKDFVTEDDLNRSRAMINLSPVKEISETEAISGMIEILRSQ